LKNWLINQTETNREHWHSQSHRTQKQAPKYQPTQKANNKSESAIKLCHDFRIASRETKPNKTKRLSEQPHLVFFECFDVVLRNESQQNRMKNSAEKRYQKLPKECQIPCVRGQEQSGELGLELLVRRVNSVRRLVLQHDLRRFRLKRHRSDEVNVDEGIGNTIKRRLGVAVISGVYETLRELRFVVDGKNLFPNTRTRICQHHHLFVLFLGTYEFSCFVLRVNVVTCCNHVQSRDCMFYMQRNVSFYFKKLYFII